MKRKEGWECWREAGEVMEFSSFHAAQLDFIPPFHCNSSCLPHCFVVIWAFFPFWKPRQQDFIIENVDPDRSALEGGKCCGGAGKG